MSVIRRMMMRSKKYGGGAIKRGTLTVPEQTTRVHLQHNIGSGNYIAMLRKVVPVWGVNGSIGGFVQTPVTWPYNTQASGGPFTKSSGVVEVRSTSATYCSLWMAYNFALIEQLTTDNECTFICRANDNSYVFLPGDYEWIVINLDREPDYEQTITTAEDVHQFDINHNLNTEDVFMYYEANPKTYNLYGGVAGLFVGSWFSALYPDGSTYRTQALNLVFETRDPSVFPSFQDNTQLFASGNPSPLSDADNARVIPRGRDYFWRPATWIFKVYKL